MKRLHALLVSSVFTLLCTLSFAADVDGDWSMTLSAPEGTTYITMTISVDGEQATGTTADSEVSGTYKNGKLKLEGKLYLADGGYASDMEMEAELRGEKLKGTMGWDTYTLTVDGSRK
ncbi:MAG: hypothetical protein ACR2Q3_07265 [Woeseiaceae bacterium]